MAEPVAAIDCGTNTVRLLVTDGERDLARRMDITRLGAGVDRLGHFDPLAADRTLAVLTEHRRMLDELGVAQVRMATTSASRDATDRDDFFARVQDVVGVAPEVLSGEEEGRLAFAGATAGVDASRGPFCVVDIGGGSTEFGVGSDELDRVLSVDMGSVRFTERYIESDPPQPEELVACLSVAEAHLADVVRELPELDDVRTWIGVAGTITTVAAVEQGVEYDRERIHHFRLTHAAVEDVFRTLALESVAERRHNPGLEPERVDVIVGGVIVLASILRTFEIDEVLVSEDDILDGLARSLAEP